MEIRKSTGERIFDLANVIVLSLASLVVLLPIVHVLASSLSSTQALVHAKVSLWPVELNLGNYAEIMRNDQFWRSFGISAFVVVVGTLIALTVTVLMAYPLSKSYLRGRNAVMLMVVLTMIFYPPMIPLYLTVKSVGLMNTVWAMIIPSAMAQFNLLICLTFFRSLPEELYEAARMDGMSESRMVWRIAVPLSKPIMMTLGLFYAEFFWNNYSSSLLYVTKTTIRPLQLFMYYMIAKTDMNEMTGNITEHASTISPQGLQMATIIIATIPIVIIYPFIQKHFIKGALVGSIKE